MSTYPYILLPQLLLDFMAAYSTSVGAEVGEAALARKLSRETYRGVGSIREQLLNRIPRSPIKTTQNRQWLSVRVQLKWVGLRHILMLLPGIILSYAALTALLNAFGNWGALVLIGYSSGWAICLWQQRNAIAPYLLGSSLDYTSNKSLTLRESPASTVNAVAVRSASSESASLQKLKQLKKALNKQVRQPSGVSDAIVGASERDFNKVLEQYFPGRVQTQLKFPFAINGREYAYSIDFAIVFDEIGVCIDCEIDEPYDYKSRRPTHCIDQQADAIRNSFFVEGNWIVIRFSEAQIVLHPHSCCKTIAALVSRIIGSNKFLREFENVPDLKPTPKWTKRQAKRMAKQRVRDRYLSRRVV
jgi:very-short-patch-repair endonuclease